MSNVGLSIPQAMALARQRLEAGLPSQARDIYRQIVGHRPDHAEALQALGDALVTCGELDEAIESYRRAIALDGAMAVAWSNLGVALDGLGRLDEAIAACRKAVELDGGFVDAWHNLGIALGKNRRFAEAAAAQERVVELAPEHAKAHFELGVAWHELRQYGRAMQCYRRSMALDPQSAKPPHSMGVACYEQGRYAEALEWFEKSIALDDEFAEARWHKAVVQLLLGEFEEGWRGYEWRWRCREIRATRRKFAQEVWTGQELAGKTILLYAEQGFGDAIQFVRYAALLAGRGARVIVECHPELVEVMRSVAGVSRVVARGEKLPQFDLHASLLDMPLRFGTRLVPPVPSPAGGGIAAGEIPPVRALAALARLVDAPVTVPYLAAPAERIAAWRARLGPRGGKMRVGLVWAGSAAHSNDANRSLRLEQLWAGLKAARGNVRFYSLQKGPAAAQAYEPAAGMELVNLGPELRDFGDTAAAIEQLDLVISVDTAVAHLAGAMGKQVWVLLPFVPDFRWMIGRDDSPWYPTMRLFRQKSPGDWESVLREVDDALRREVEVR